MRALAAVEHTPTRAGVQPSAPARILHDAAGRVGSVRGHIGPSGVQKRILGRLGILGGRFWRGGTAAGNNDAGNEAEQESHGSRVATLGRAGKVNG